MSETPAFEFTWNGRLFKVYASGRFEVCDSPFTPGTEMVINRIPLMLAMCETRDGAIYAAASQASMSAQEKAELDAAIDARLGK